MPMEPSSRSFLEAVLRTPSPSGFEQPVQRLVREYTTPFADAVTTDAHGNVTAARFPGDRPRAPGTPAGPHGVMLAGHADQIGLMVVHIDAEGFLSVQPIGGVDMQILLGQALTVWTRTGPVAGVVARRAIHLMTPEERNKVPAFTDIWVDIGAANKADAERVVTHGDPVTFQLGLRDLRNGLISGAALDDKVGLWVCVEALRHLKARELKTAVYAVATVAEEIGLRGATTAAYALNPAVGIAVDVCHATDTPGTDKKQVGDVKLGAGPVVVRGPNINPKVFDLLEATAAEHAIPIQVRGSARATGTDANAIQISRQGVAAGLIGIPNRYMHSPVEVCHADDLVYAARLLAEFCAAVTPGHDWTP